VAKLASWFTQPNMTRGCLRRGYRHHKIYRLCEALVGVVTVLLTESDSVQNPSLDGQPWASDQFLETQLKPELLQRTCARIGAPLTLRKHEGCDHSYFFISTFIEDHLRLACGATEQRNRSITERIRTTQLDATLTKREKNQPRAVSV
jgi:hypothetical protein